MHDVRRANASVISQIHVDLAEFTRRLIHVKAACTWMSFKGQDKNKR